METKSKTVTKVISLFLAVLMAVSCFSIAMPNLAVKADAAATTAQINTFINAVKAGVSAGFFGSAYASSGTQSVTITDSTDKGYIYTAAEALFAVINAEKSTSAGSNYSHNLTLRSRIKSLCSSNGYTLPSGAQALVDQVLPSTGNYNSYPQSSPWTSEGTANANAPGVGISSMSLNFTITRTVQQAVANYSTVASVPSTFNTQMRVTYTGSIYSWTTSRTSDWSTGSGSDKHSGTDTYRKQNAYYYNSAVSASYSTSSAPNLTAITNYLNYVGGSSFKPGYDQYMANNACVYDWTADTLNGVKSGYEPYRTAINSVAQAYVSQFIGTTALNNYDRYVDTCVGAATATTYKPYIDWINCIDGSIPGAPDASTYPDYVGVDTPEARAALVTLRTNATNYRKILSDLTQGVKDALVFAYAYDDAPFAEFLTNVTDAIEQYDLRQIKYAVDARINGTTADLYNGDTAMYGVSEYESYIHGFVVDNDMLMNAYSWFDAECGAIDGFKVANINAVFGDNTASYVKNFRSALQTEILYRNQEATFNSFYSYFEGVFYIDFSKVKSTAIENYIATAESKQSELITKYNETVSQVGATKANQIYGNYRQTVANYIQMLYNTLYQRTYDQLKYMEDCYNGGITASNFSLVKRAIANIDTDLYNYVVGKSSKYPAANINTIKTYYSHIAAYSAAVDAQIAKAWTAYQTIQLDGGTGTYTVRYAREDDMVRDVNDNDGDVDNYTVTEAKIKTVISKLDNFLTSDDFAKLIGAYDEEKGIANLSDYIDSLMTDMLFNDKMINTIVGLLFPMVCQLLENTVYDLLSTGLGDMSCTPSDSYADGAINLNGLVSGLGGKLNLYVNGKSKGGATAKTFSAIFIELGLYLYPKDFASRLSSINSSKYAATISALNSAGTNWFKFDTDGDESVSPEELNFVWGVSDYNSFVTVMGDVFSTILPVLQVFLCNYTLSKNITDLAVADSFENVSYGSILNSSVTAYGDCELTLHGLRAYEDVWAPIFEALGISQTVSGYATGTGSTAVKIATPLSTSIGNSGNSATAAQVCNALFIPLLALIDKVANKPLDTVLGILPNVAQFVSYNLIEQLIANLKITVDYSLTIDIDSGGFLAKIVDAVGSSFLKGIAKGSYDLVLGTVLNLSELIGCDISDLNALANFIFDKIGTLDEESEALAVSLPDINAGKLASLGSKTTLSSIRTTNYYGAGAGKRYSITADKADVLYDLIQWLLDFVAIEGNLSGLLKDLDVTELPAEVDAILGGINADSALAALVEMFLPQTYSMQDYDWYQSNSSMSTYNLTYSSFVYLKYANNWTQEKADYLYNNLDSVVNTIVGMIDPDLLSKYGGINEMILDIVNSMFDNKGVMNVLDLVTGLGESMVDSPEIVALIQRETGVDMLAWYNTYGYLYEEYYHEVEVKDEVTGVTATVIQGPPKPGEAGYVNNFTDLTFTTSLDEEGNTVYAWKIGDTALIDGADNARQVFTDIFCDLIIPFAPVLDLVLTGKNLGLFKDSIIIQGYGCYSSAIVPIYETLGITDLMTQSEYNAYVNANGSDEGFNYLVNKLFDRLTDLLTIETRPDGTTYGPVQKVVDMLPSIFYFLQSDGITTLLKNMLQPIWVLIDTIRPIANIDLDDFIHQFLTLYLGLVYDKTDSAYTSAPLVDLIMGLITKDNEDLVVPEYSAAQAAEDKAMVDGIYDLTVENLSLESIYKVINLMFGLDLKPLTYAFEGMCCPYTKNGTNYGIYSYTSKSGKIQPNGTDTAYNLKYYGADIITVTISALLDTLRWPGNAAALDKMIGLVKESTPDDGTGTEPVISDKLSAQGLLEALLVVFEDKVADFDQPNWDYLLEGKSVYNPEDGSSTPWVDGDYAALQEYADLSPYHSINNLDYLTDWTYDTAYATETMLSGVLDYVASSIDSNYTNFTDFIDGTLNEKLFTGDMLKTLAGAIASLYNMVPQNIIALIDNLLDIDLSAWYEYVELVDETETDEEGNVTLTGKQIYAAKETYKWWDETNPEFVDSRDKFLDAVKQIVLPADKIISLVFLGENYKLFYTIDEGPSSDGYGGDAVVINGAYAYAYGTVPILEALGIDLTGYEPSKYTTTDAVTGEVLYNSDLFITDLFDVFVQLFDTIIHDPLNWVVNNLPGFVYFINAKGVSTCINNIFGSIKAVIDAVNTQLDDESLIDLSKLINGIDLSNINLASLFGLLEEYLGVHISDELIDYMSTLYVGDLSYFTSANGNGAFTMKYSDDEDRADMITILLSLVVQVVTDAGSYVNADGETVDYDNAAAIDKMLSKEGEEPSTIVSAIVGILKNPAEIEYKDINWNYFDEDFNLGTVDGVVSVPGYAFQYLNYTTDWTYTKASKTAEGFETLLNSLIPMINPDATSLTDLLKGIIDLDNFYTGENLQKVLDTVSGFCYGEDAILNESLINVAGCVLGADLTEWNKTYAFETKSDEYTYEVDDTTGLPYRMAEVMLEVPATEEGGESTFEPTGEYIKTFAISDRESFITGLMLLLQPAYRLLNWLLFGEGYEFFNSNTEAGQVLITVLGGNGYKEGLVLLLEALGCKGLKFADTYVNDDGTHDMAACMSDIVTSVCNRVDELIEDPVTEVVNLIPELIYFINAGGLQSVIGNLLSAPLNLLNKVAELSGNEGLSVDGLVTDLLRKALNNEELTFALDDINLEYIFTVLESATGLEITDVVGNSLKYFYMGEVRCYASKSGKLAYAMGFSKDEDFADFITILLSFIVDVALYDGNASALETLLNVDAGTVTAIVDVIKNGWTVNVENIDWFYFDETYGNTVVGEDGAVIDNASALNTMPVRTINYLTYASDWTEETADYIYTNRNSIVSSVIKLITGEDSTASEIISKSFSLENDLYTADNLNKILTAVKGITENFDATILELLGIVLDLDLTKWNTMGEFTAEEITDRQSFVNGLNEIIAPIYSLLDWLLFGDNLTFFDKKTGEGIETLIDLPGSYGYAYALVPIFEALGVTLPAVTATDNTKSVFFVLVNNVLARIEAILDNPVDEIVAMLPNILYFINANGLATCINNLLAGVIAMLDAVNPILGENAVDIDAILAGLFEGTSVTVDLKKLDLLGIVSVIEQGTGIKIAEVLTENKIDNFYLGKLSYFTSANGKPAFRMEYSTEEDPGDMLTIIANLAVEILLYDGNATAIDALLGDNTQVQDIVNVIMNIGTVDYIDLNWNYFDDTADLGALTIPATAFVYLNYSNDWTYEKAAYLSDGLDALISEVLTLTGSDATSVAELLAGAIDLSTVFSAENLNKILDLVAGFLYGEDAVLDTSLLTLIGLVLGADLTQWDSSYRFEAYDEANVYTTDAATGLKTRTVDSVTTYAVADTQDFISGLCVILQPAERLVSWLLLGNSYGFFVDNATGADQLIKIAGADGYSRGLSILLEALGCKGLKKANEYADATELIRGVLTSLVNRVNEILADPVNEVIALIPEVIYFINAGGLNSVVNNLAGAALNILDAIRPLGVDVSIDELITGVLQDATGNDTLTFTLSNVNLQYVLELAEQFTGLEITDAIGTSLETFAIGEVVKYDTVSDYSAAYKMQFASTGNGTDAARDRADMITIVLSVILDVLQYKDAENNIDNAAAIEKLIGDTVAPGTIDQVIAVISGYTVDMMDVDWFYFSPEVDVSTIKKDDTLTTPTRTINYLSYASNWTQGTAQYIDENIDEIIAAVLKLAGKGETTVAEVLADSFTLDDLYTAENLNKIVDAISGLTAQVGETLLNLVGMVLDVDVAQWASMEFTDAEITDKASFVAGLTQVVAPLYKVLDWLLFGDSYSFFSKLTADGTDDLLTVTGAEGYVYGLVPMLEALGVNLPAYTAGNMSADLFEDVILAVLARAEEILADPVNEVLALLPNILYFINANGIAVGVNNLASAVLTLLDKVNPLLVSLGSKSISVNDLINDALADYNVTVDIKKLDLLAICEVIEGITGIEITDVVTADKLDNFFIGDISYFQSTNGKAAFKMAYSTEEDRADMITIVANFLVEVLVYGDNAAKIDELIGTDGTVQTIVNVITDNDSLISYSTLKWNYFDETVTLGDITVPVSTFAYLNYSNDWTYDKAAYFDTGLNNLISQVLTLTGSEATTVAELLAGAFNPEKDLYTAENLNKILDLVSGYLYGENAVLGESLVNLVGAVLGTELTSWNYQYSFEAYDATATYMHDETTGFDYRVADGKVINAIANTEDFINGLCLVLEPAEPLLAWLLMGGDYGFFVDSAEGTKTLINIRGGEGYAKGLALLLEALGCEGLESTYADANELLKAVLTSVTDRISAILANPVDEILALIPEILYFINANGLSVVVNNLAASVFHLLDGLKPLGVELNVDELITGVLQDALGNDTVTFSLDGVNLEYIFEIVEIVSGIELTDVIGHSLDKFAIGEVTKYDSVSGFENTYKMTFAVTGNGTDAARDRADFITILLSLVLDVVRYKDADKAIDNAATIEALIGDSVPAGTIDDVIAVITSYEINMKDIDWFYFDEGAVLDGENVSLTMPVRTINYLTYASDWTENVADYIDDNLDGIISAVLDLTGNGDTTVAEIVKGLFDPATDLYTAANLNKIVELISGLTEKVEKVILDVAGVVLDVNLSAWDSMVFDELEITDKQTFTAGLVEIIAPIYEVLDWLLFGEDYNFFSNASTGVQNLITVTGAEGYAYGLVPVLEALGVNVPVIDYVNAYSTEDILEDLLLAVFTRVETVLADPVNEVLALIPNILYFINANGLAASVNNLVSAALALVEKVNPVLVDLGQNEINVNDLVNGLVADYGFTIDLNNIDLLALVKIAETLTGLNLTEFVTEQKIDNFYLGEITYFKSANGNAAFRMQYSATHAGEDRADLITVVFNYLIETVLYGDNAKTLDTLIGLDGTVENIIGVITTLGTAREYDNVNWNYFGGSVDEYGVITLPTQPFANYLTYVTDWTQSKADYLYDNLDDIITGVLKMTGKDETADTVAKLISNSFTLYNAEYLNAILKAVQQLYTVIDDKLTGLLGVVLDVDLSTWEGLSFTDAEIYDADTFRAGLVEIIKPVYQILDWLLFGDDYNFFVKSADGATTLLNIEGSNGYAEGLVPILEALGVKLPAIPADAKCENMFSDVLKAIFARVDEILADPIDEALRLIPNLLYFISANGLTVTVENLAGGIFNVLDSLKPLGVDVNITELLGGFDISDISIKSLVKLAEDKTGLTLYDLFETADGNCLDTFYIGKITKFLSTNGYVAYNMSYADEDKDRGDLLTMLLSVVLEVALYDDNAPVLDGLFGLNEGSFDAIRALVAGCTFELDEIDWVYFLGLTDDTARQAALDAVLAAHVNELPAVPQRTSNYITYLNNWNEETAQYVIGNLPGIVDLIISLVTESPDLSTFIGTELNLYSDATVDKIVGYVVNALSKLDIALQDAIGCVLDVDLEALRNFHSEGVTDKASFVASLSSAVSTLGSLLDWLLFNQKYTFFTDLETGTQPTITLNGGEGFLYGLVPVLEALGVDFTGLVIPEATEDKTITEQVVNEVLTDVCNRIDVLFANPIDEVLALLPNIIYFINANGVSVSASNLLAPIDALIRAAAPVAGDENLSFASVIKFDVSKLDLKGICDIVLDKTNIDVYGAIGEYMSMFYFGKLNYFKSYNGDGAFRMVYSATEEKHDMITILLSVVLDVFSFGGNKDALSELLGADTYMMIMAFLHGNESMVAMQDFSWILVDHADTEEVLSPIYMDGLYNYMYGKMYTREMGEYITKWFPTFVDTMITLLGIENTQTGSGDVFKSLEDILKTYIGTTVYTTDLLNTLFDAIKGLVAQLDTVPGIEYIKETLRKSLDIDLDYWNGYTVNAIADNDRTAFVSEVCRMVAPIYPVIEWLFTSKDLAFLADSEANDYIVIKGAEGYKYGIIPILEALRCENVLTQEEYEAAAATDKTALLSNILVPILDRLDVILADPMTEIFVELPSIIYFINSNGLDTCFRNLLNAVYSVLDTIKPVTGDINLYEALFGEGFDLANIDFEYFFELLISGVEKSTGFKLSKPVSDAISELTLGTVRSFTSKNGQTAYTMDYTTGGDKVDLTTVVLRLVLTFVSIEDNVKALNIILKDKLSKEGYEFVSVLLTNFGQMAASEGGMDQIMYTVYYIFYAANVAASQTDNWLKNFNGDYTFIGQLFQTSDVSFLNNIWKQLSDFLNNNTSGDVVDDTGIAPNGFIKFFQAIANFFKKIAEFFQKLFK